MFPDAGMILATYDDEKDYPDHHPAFDVNEEYLPEVTIVLCQFTFDWQEYFA